MLIVFKEYQRGSGDWAIQCDELVGTGKNWKAPATVLGKSLPDFMALLKENGAEFTVYKKPGTDTVSFIGYCWKDQKDMRAFKNLLNRIARAKRITLKEVA